MANNIVEGLFGLSPFDAQQRQNAANQQYAAALAQADPFVAAKMSLGQAGAGLGQLGAGMLGMVNPEVDAAKRREAALGQVDFQSPEGILTAAKAAGARGDARMQLQLQLLAQKRIAEQQDAEVKTTEMAKNLAQTQKAEVKTTEMAKNLAQTQKAMRVTIGSGNQPPKNLTREARLKWELENGKIDQATYDAAIAATPGAKLQTEKISAANAAITGFDAVERNINAIYDSKTKSLRGAAKPLFGKYTQYRPNLLQTQESVDANLAFESLTNQVMMANLADAKERVGQSFGSMQVQEWDKFTQQITSLKRGMSEKAVAESMEYIMKFIKTKRNVLNTALGQSKIEVPSSNNGGTTVSNW